MNLSIASMAEPEHQSPAAGTATGQNNNVSDESRMPSSLNVARESLACSRHNPLSTHRGSVSLATLLPMFLLALLLLSMMKFCSDSQQKQQLTQERDELQQALDTAEQTADSQAGTIATMETEVEAAKSQIADLEDQLQSAGEQLTAMQTERDSARTELTDLQGQLQTATDLRKSVGFDLDLARKTNSANTATMAELRAQSKSLIATHQQETERLSARIAELESLQGDTAPDITAYMKQIDVLSSENASLLTQLDVAVDERDVANTELGEQRELVAEQQAAMAELEPELVALQRSNSEAAQLLEKFERKVAVSNYSREVITNHIHTLKDSLAETGNTAADATDLNTQLQGQVSELQQSLAQAREELSAVKQASLDAASMERAAAEAELERDAAQADVDEQRELIAAHESTIEKLEAEVDALQKSNVESAELLEKFEQKVAVSNYSNKVITEHAESLAEGQSAVAPAADGDEQSKGQIAELEQTLARVREELSVVKQQAAEEKQTLQQAISSLQVQHAAASRSAGSYRDETLNVRNAIAQRLSALEVDGVSVQTTDNDTAIAVSAAANIIYRNGSASLSRQGTSVLSKVGDVLSDYPQWRIVVEGHTDSAPVDESLRSVFPSNWELSSARASTVVDYLTLTSEINPDNLSARGFADSRPIAGNDTSEGQQQNRRVDIVLRRR